jgi:hypothetical protein
MEFRGPEDHDMQSQLAQAIVSSAHWHVADKVLPDEAPEIRADPNCRNAQWALGHRGILLATERDRNVLSNSQNGVRGNGSLSSHPLCRDARLSTVMELEDICCRPNH